jgi:hypothetical protein
VQTCVVASVIASATVTDWKIPSVPHAGIVDVDGVDPSEESEADQSIPGSIPWRTQGTEKEA